jgi:peptidoglycan-associated lipoprotein
MLNNIYKTGLLISVALLASACSKKNKPVTLPDYSDDINTETKLMQSFIHEAGNKVHFKFNEATLSSEAKQKLDRQLAFINANTDNGKLKIVVEGFCDIRGTEEYNIGLGARRAEAVRSYFAKHGVPAANIEVISFGKEKPEALGDSEEAHAINRRAATILNTNGFVVSQ